MAITVLGARRRLHRLGLGDCLPEQRFEQLLGEGGVKWRRRLLAPAVVLRLFVLQVLQGNVAINALRQLSGTAFSASAFCKARQRLPLWALSQLLRELVSGTVRENRRATVGSSSWTDRACRWRTRRHCVVASGCRPTSSRASATRRPASWG